MMKSRFVGLTVFAFLALGMHLNSSAQEVDFSISPDSLYNLIQSDYWEVLGENKQTFQLLDFHLKRNPTGKHTAYFYFMLLREVYNCSYPLNEEAVWLIRDKAIRYLTSINDTYHLARVYSSYGIFEATKDNLDSALLYNKLAKDYFWQIAQKGTADKSIILLLAAALNNEGYYIYSGTSDNDSDEIKKPLAEMMISAWQKADSVCSLYLGSDNCSNQSFLPVLNLANLYGHYVTNITKAEFYYQRARKHLEECNSPYSYQLKRSMAFTYLFGLNDPIRAKTLFREIMNISTVTIEMNDRATIHHRIELNKGLSICYFKLNQLDSCRYFGDRLIADTLMERNATSVADISLNIASLLIGSNQRSEAVKYLAIYNRFVNEFQNERTMFYNNHVLSNSNDRYLRMQARYETLVEGNSHQSYYLKIAGGIIFIIVCIFVGIIFLGDRLKQFFLINEEIK